MKVTFKNVQTILKIESIVKREYWNLKTWHPFQSLKGLQREQCAGWGLFVFSQCKHPVLFIAVWYFRSIDQVSFLTIIGTIFYGMFRCPAVTYFSKIACLFPAKEYHKSYVTHQKSNMMQQNVMTNIDKNAHD